MSEPTKTHDLMAHTFNFLGIPFDTLGGYGEGDGTIKCEKQDPDFLWKRGADGSVVRFPTHSLVWVVTLTLLQTAAANTILSGINQLDVKTSNGAGVGPFLLQNRNGLFTLEASEAWVEGPPKTIEIGNAVANLEWVFVLADGKALVGGA